MTSNITKHWEVDRVDCPSASIPTLITRLRGGESITLKSKESSQGSHQIFPSKSGPSGRGYYLDGGETMTLTLPISFGQDNEIEIWALPENAGADITFFKLIGLFPGTEAST
ncbi:MAG: hypothetical protein KAQ85_00775 [Thermodesulfovibrionia bacterium]|nr:hypothetical protein [Thermodesulfovibrionia bacterium]